MADYNFLEDSKRISEVAKRSFVVDKLSYNLKLVKREALKRQINVLTLPTVMTRRKQNTSIYVKK